MMPASAMPASDPPAVGARLVTTEGRELPLERATIEVRARAGLAQVVLRQRFRNHHLEPLAVRYQVPLPADGAVSAFAFTIGSRRVAGVIDRKERARERYEEALVQGQAAALLDQERSSVFSQEIGNIPPGAAIEAEIAIDQPLIWLAEGAWEWRFPTVVAPRYDAGVVDAEAIAVEVSATPIAPRVGLALIVEGDARPSSTSHAIAVERRPREVVVGFGDEGAALDRDVVVRWPAAPPELAAELSVARPPADHAVSRRAFGLLTLAPPTSPPRPVPRDLVILIDASGSMHGPPLDQARRLALALVESLREGDSLMMISFAITPQAFRPEPVTVTPAAKVAARRWLERLEAAGGTEMRAGILAALAPLRADAQRQVVLMSDGLIGFESESVGTILDRLPAGSRVHTVGVGSAVNRSLTASAARAGRGVEVILGIGDDVERALTRIVHHTAAPSVVDLSLGGSALLDQAPRRLPDLFAAAPARISLALRPEGGTLTVAGRTAEGRFETTLEVVPVGFGEGDMAIARRFARERVEDLEAERSRGEDVDGEIERLGLDFAIATRRTSWVAISEEPDVDPTAPGRRETMPQALAHGMSAGALGLRRGMPPPAAAPAIGAVPMAPPAPAGYGGPARAARRPPPRVEPPAPADEVAALEEGAFLREPASSAPAGPSVPPGRSAPAASSGPVPSREGPLVVPGVVRLLRADRLVIEVELPCDLAWDPRHLRLVLRDGRTLALPLDPGVSTGAGSFAAGAVVRLAFALPAALSAPPTRVELANGGDPFVVSL